MTYVLLGAGGLAVLGVLGTRRRPLEARLRRPRRIPCGCPTCRSCDELLPAGGDPP
jgi:hypothetical protein